VLVSVNGRVDHAISSLDEESQTVVYSEGWLELLAG
jgi:hypothetical protein